MRSEYWVIEGLVSLDERTADFFRLQGSVMLCGVDMHCHLTGCPNMASRCVPCWHFSLIVYMAKTTTDHVIW